MDTPKKFFKYLREGEFLFFGEGWGVVGSSGMQPKLFFRNLVHTFVLVC